MDIWTKMRINCHFLNTLDKIFEGYLEALRQQFTISKNNSLSSNFLLVTKAKIHFDKRNTAQNKWSLPLRIS